MRAPLVSANATARTKEDPMLAHPCRVLPAVLVALLAAAAGGVPRARAADEAKPAQAAKPAPAAAAQKHFASPDAAVSALIAAARAKDWKAELLPILGPEAKTILDSGDPVADAEGLERFVASYDEGHELEQPDADWAELSVGKDDWPFPIPIVKESAGWRFDTDEGDEEILARRIGRNERFTIQTMLAIVDAQREYYEDNPDKAPLLHYARRILSSEGKRDGLYYPTAEGEEPSPLGPLIGEARGEGYRREAGKPAPAFHGYYYRLLEVQGPHATDGAYAYVVDGRMLGGFAVLAYPATWDNSGIMSFMVNQDGVVYEKDLGAEGAKVAQAIRSFDPDGSWKKVPEEDQAPEPPDDSVADE
jgi:hypothetical protein